MIAVLSFCDADSLAAERVLRWAAELDGSAPPNWSVLLSFEPCDGAGPVIDAAHTFFARRVEQHERKPVPIRKWPMGGNHAFQQTVRVAPRMESWLWWEPDAIPVQPGWLDKLRVEYERGGKPLMGTVSASGYVNGVAIYPPRFAEQPYAAKALHAFATPWDVNMSAAVLPHTHAANALMQHVWATAPDGTPILGSPQEQATRGASPTFPTQHHVDACLTPGVALFHRCKDDSLVTRLRQRRVAVAKAA